MYFLDTFVYSGTVHVYWGQIWWWLWLLQLLEAAGHHFFESCSDAARQLPEQCINFCWMSGVLPHLMNAFIKTNSTLPSAKFGSSGTSVQCNWTDPVLQALQAVWKRFDISVFLIDCLKSVHCESCTAGPVTFLKNNLMFASLRGFLNKPRTLQIHWNI